MGDMLEFAKECGPNVGLLLDVWHWHHAGGTTAEILKAGKERIVHVHFNDSPKLPPEEIRDNERLMPGEGVIDLQGALKALQTIGYEDAFERGGVRPASEGNDPGGRRTARPGFGAGRAEEGGDSGEAASTASGAFRGTPPGATDLTNALGCDAVDTVPPALSVRPRPTSV